MKIKWTHGIICVLICTNAASLIALMAQYIWFQYQSWPSEAHVMAAGFGSAYAQSDFQKSRRRIFRLEENSELKFTGEKEGPFEIWAYPTFSILPKSSHITTQTWIESYNSRMRRLQDETEKEAESAPQLIPLLQQHRIKTAPNFERMGGSFQWPWFRLGEA